MLCACHIEQSGWAGIGQYHRHKLGRCTCAGVTSRYGVGSLRAARGEHSICPSSSAPRALPLFAAPVAALKSRTLTNLPNAWFCRDGARSATRAAGPVVGGNLALGGGHRGRPRGWRGPSGCRIPLPCPHLGADSWRHKTCNTLMLLILGVRNQAARVVARDRWAVAGHPGQRGLAGLRHFPAGRRCGCP